MINSPVGRQSFRFLRPPAVRAAASVAGKLEGQGPLKNRFDEVFSDSLLGTKTWEQAEQAMQSRCLDLLLKKAQLTDQDLSAVFSGDLNNQCIASSFALRNRSIPHLGLYGACSTMAESLILGAMAVGGGCLKNAACLASSHFCTAERQYRYPLGYGGQRTPTAQWTVTGAGAVLLTPTGPGAKILGCTMGVVTDLGITDANNMGCAMAPAALSTIKSHFSDFGTCPNDYDLIVTGDLGQLGKDMLLELASREGLALGGKIADCGSMIYDNTVQDVGCGGSGAGCSALVLCTELLKSLETGEYQNILFCGTGALLSPLTVQQKLPIPGICHAVHLTREEIS